MFAQMSLQSTFNLTNLTMRLPLALFIAFRYTRAKKKNHFVSFISLSSMLGIGLGVMVLITVLSVMNGFDAEIHKRFFGMVPEITVSRQIGYLDHWQALKKRLSQRPEIQAVSAFVNSQALILSNGEVLPVVLTGVLPQAEEAITHLQDKILVGSAMNLQHFGVVLGKNLANLIGVGVGDKITLMIPQASVSLAGMSPRFKRFEVRGIFSAGTGFNFDSKLAFIQLEDAQKLLQMSPTAVSGLRIKIGDVDQAPIKAAEISQELGEAYQVGDWTDNFGAFFDAIKMEKTMMFLILMLIIAVAAFNLVSSLVMIVNDKQAEIAILRTLGASPRLILAIFMLQGMLIGGVGIIIGLMGGLLLASHATQLVNYLQTMFDLRILSSSIYFIDYLPSKIVGSDLLIVSLSAALMSFLATLYPAWRASKTQIAEALHYE